jgi:Immunity protein Imm5
MEISAIVAQCEADLDFAVAEFEPGHPPRLEIPLGWRVRLWDAMNNAFPIDARLRRGLLAYSVACQATEEWKNVALQLPSHTRELPQQLLKVCRRALQGEITEQQAQQGYKVDAVEAAMGLEDDIGLPAYAPLAAFAAIKCAVAYEEAIYQELFYAKVADDSFVATCEESRDWMGWDTHFWASCVAGGFPGSTRYDQQRRTDFWRRWLRKDLPSVLGDIRALRHSLGV